MSSFGEHVTSSTSTKTGASGAMAPSSVWTPSNKVSPRKRRRTIRLAVAAIALAAYIGGAYYFSSHFTPGTTVDGVEAGNMTVSELADAIQQRAASYEQHITGGDGFEMTIPGSEVGLSCEGTQVAEEAMNRTVPALWLPYCISPKHMLIDAHIEADEETLTARVNDAVAAYNEGAEPPTNASGTFDEEQDAFVTTKESVGTQLDAAKVIESSAVAFRELRDDVTLDESALAQPAITDQDETLLANIAEANKIVDNGDIEIECDGQTVATIDRATMIPWFYFDEEQHYGIKGAGDWVRDNKAIQDAGNATDDEHVWALDFQATVDEIHRVMEKDLGEKAQVKRTAIETKPPVTPGAKERGRHIDINLTTQFARFYDTDGKVIWDSYCVTGGWDTEKGVMHHTPTGEFAIQTKATNTVLTGADTDKDGKPDYESFVNYWMPFLNYDYGLHDATWRDEFGGDIYTYWGSHGCVNLPLEKAEQLFNLVKVGDPVIVHE